MLIFLTETNILNYLNTRGIYPDSYYTSIKAFKEDMISFNDATVVIVFSGNCRFNRKLTTELAITLQSRAEKGGLGISDVVILTDMELPEIKKYFYYTDSPDIADEYIKGKKTRSDLKILSDFVGEPKKSYVKLNSYDRGDITKPLNSFNNRNTFDDKYKELIKIPETI